MKKYILIASILCLVAGGVAAAYYFIEIRKADDDPVKMENSIIIHGIKMTSETPPSESEEEADGQIIYDDTFDDAIIDYDRIKNRKSGSAVSKDGGKDFEKLRLKDRRWHLRRYEIKKNDNLWKIARRFGIHQHLIISINNINNPDMLKPGKYINVPTRKGIYYQVRKGDTITRIAGRHNIRSASIIVQNGLKGKMIRPGQKLFLPDAVERHEETKVAIKKNKGPSPIIAGIRNFVWPLRGRITSGFGNRTDPLYGERQFHCGIDISANVGTPVKAAASGRVIFSGWKAGYGNCVILRHENGFITVYAHNSKNLASVDGDVKQGEVLAYSGMTGAVTGAHLHFEIRKYVNPLNPLRFLR
ncbi:MAG TPA: M23 family metallopeptidase [Spirochaetota bacterium]|nr:M23 family metallopeptidase [Spirochaetota bacterium]HPC40396.1 M23 family metallopeptidase [Spirochaetota bacterium]HPL17322.1 M23 family metallopeptidase [Spirochaetota bacterium]HQF07695.1 M23 family metallopeptidase [Spirochaetota bacterium]HQH96427.1 M23 family metallopeptidase [Spirochaetota bacterium]